MQGQFYTWRRETYPTPSFKVSSKPREEKLIRHLHARVVLYPELRNLSGTSMQGYFYTWRRETYPTPPCKVSSIPGAKKLILHLHARSVLYPELRNLSTPPSKVSSIPGAEKLINTSKQGQFYTCLNIICRQKNARERQKICSNCDRKSQFSLG